MRSVQTHLIDFGVAYDKICQGLKDRHRQVTLTHSKNSYMNNNWSSVKLAIVKEEKQLLELCEIRYHSINKANNGTNKICKQFSLQISVILQITENNNQQLPEHLHRYLDDFMNSILVSPSITYVLSIFCRLF